MLFWDHKAKRYYNIHKHTRVKTEREKRYEGNGVKQIISSLESVMYVSWFTFNRHAKLSPLLWKALFWLCLLKQQSCTTSLKRGFVLFICAREKTDREVIFLFRPLHRETLVQVFRCHVLFRKNEKDLKRIAYSCQNSIISRVWYSRKIITLISIIPFSLLVVR